MESKVIQIGAIFLVMMASLLWIAINMVKESKRLAKQKKKKKKRPQLK